MPYTDEQKKEHIRELQTYLYGISLFDRRIPQVLPDGLYDKYTKQAVEAFQRQFGVNPTGIVGAVTWDRIAEVYSDLRYGFDKRPYQNPGYTIK